MLFKARNLKKGIKRNLAPLLIETLVADEMKRMAEGEIKGINKKKKKKKKKKKYGGVNKLKIPSKTRRDYG